MFKVNCTPTCIQQLDINYHSSKNKRKLGHIMYYTLRESAANVRSSSTGSMQSSDLTCSKKSASLRLVWDDPQWDEQGDFPAYGQFSL